ncbi:MAG: hypothetical protein ACLUEK_08890 [Oscillospiraceae bacterium]
MRRGPNRPRTAHSRGCSQAGALCRARALRHGRARHAERVARALNAEALADIYFLNQADAAGEGAARALAALLERPALWGSIQKGEITC